MIINLYFLVWWKKWLATDLFCLFRRTTLSMVIVKLYRNCLQVLIGWFVYEHCFGKNLTKIKTDIWRASTYIPLPLPVLQVDLEYFNLQHQTESFSKWFSSFEVEIPYLFMFFCGAPSGIIIIIKKLSFILVLG